MTFFFCYVNERDCEKNVKGEVFYIIMYNGKHNNGGDLWIWELIIIK